MSDTLLDQLLDELAERLAERVAARLRQGEPGMVAQATSPLGPRRHCSAVRRRLARGEPGASIVGRQHLLSAAALQEELERTSAVRAEPKAPGGESVADQLRRELGLLPKAGVRKPGRRGLVQK
jgi:hypothetical protein